MTGLAVARCSARKIATAMFKRSIPCAITRKPDHVTTSPIGRPAHNLPQHIQRDEAIEKDLVRAYFGHRRGGVYVEVGANDPTSPESQSHHLETKLGWTGLLVEPIPYLAQLARDERLAAVVCECACTAPDKVGKLELLIPKLKGELMTGHASLEANIDEHNYQEFEKITVNAVTLASLCAEKNITHIDLLSIDEVNGCLGSRKILLADLPVVPQHDMVHPCRVAPCRNLCGPGVADHAQRADHEDRIVVSEF